MNMINGLEIFDDGTTSKIEVTKKILTSDRVICLVDDETKNIYIWKGRNAGVRKKFIGAYTANGLRSETGFNFRVQSLDEGEEPESFINQIKLVSSISK